MAVEDDDSPPGAPEWALTFGDMMALLLTFFILLVSMSELKNDDKFQGVADSIEERFGGDSAAVAARGESQPRNKLLASLATLGRSRRRSVVDGPSPAESEQRLRIVRPGERTAIGTVLRFAEDAVELTAENRRDLLLIAETLRGKPQKIEVRGHTSHRPFTPNDRIRDHWDLAYQRARNTMQALVDDLQIDPQRIRISVAGPYEPLDASADLQQLRDNPRAEVFLLEEVADAPNAEVSPAAGDAVGLPGT